MILITIYRTKAKRLDNYIDVFNTLTNSSFVSLKFLTLFKMEDDTRQKVFGRLMVTVLVINFIGNIVYVVYSIIMTVRYAFGCTGKVDKDETTEALNSRWKHIIVYEYPAQPLVFDAQREEPPIVVEELRDVIFERSLVMHKPKRVNQAVAKKNRVFNGVVNVGLRPVKLFKIAVEQKKEMMDKQKEDDMMDDMMEEQVVSPKKEIGKMHALIEREERDESPLKKKVLQDKTELSSTNFGQKSKYGELSEGIGLFPVKKIEWMAPQDDIRVENISEEEVA
jgi:hypothetical protein